MNQEAIAAITQPVVGTQQSLRGRTLKESAGVAVKRRAEKVPGSGVADVELDRRVEGDQFHEFGPAEVARFLGRFGGQGPGAEVGDGLDGPDLEGLAVLHAWPDRAALEGDTRGHNLRRPAPGVAGEDEAFPVVEAVRGEGEFLRGAFVERVVEEPFNQGVKATILFEDIKGVVIPAVFPDQTPPAIGRGMRQARLGDPGKP